jgi:hypothetical protein
MLSSLTYERLRELLLYDPDTGHFVWLVAPCNKVVAGSRAGTAKSNGYRQLSIDGVKYREHIVAWFYVTGEWPPYDLDHRNGIRHENYFTNLRCATEWQNTLNRVVRRDNLCGFKGVHKKGSRWRARITVNGARLFLGSFNTPEEAHTAYCAAADVHFGEFARHA